MTRSTAELNLSTNRTFVRSVARQLASASDEEFDLKKRALEDAFMNYEENRQVLLRVKQAEVGQ